MTNGTGLSAYFDPHSGMRSSTAVMTLRAQGLNAGDTARFKISRTGAYATQLGTVEAVADSDGVALTGYEYTIAADEPESLIYFEVEWNYKGNKSRVACTLEVTG